MARIVITTIGSLGDLHPKIAIALQLRERGHDVIFATHKEYQAKIEALGFEFNRMHPDNTALSDPEEMARMMDLKTGVEYTARNWICQNLTKTYTDLIDSARDAELIITGEGVLAARLVAEKLKIPWVSIVLQPIAFLSAYDPSVIPVFPWLAKLRKFGFFINKAIVQLSKLIAKSWAEPVYQLRRELKLPPLTGNPFIDDKYSPYLVLAMFSSVLAKPQPDWADNTIVTGFAFYDGSERAELSSKLKQFLDAGEPPIVFTLGSAAVMSPGNFYIESIKAAKLLNRRAVLLIGKNAPPTNLSSDIIAVNYAPYSQIFSYAVVVVHQGGIGTTAQALRAACPTIVMPYSHDQPDNAARAERLGISRTLPRNKYSAKRVAKELNELLTNPGYQIKAAEVAQIIRQEDGIKTACDAVESVLHKQYG